MSTVNNIGNSYSVAELWIEFFEFYSLGFNVNDDVVSIRNVGGFSRDEKQWKGKKLAIEGNILLFIHPPQSILFSWQHAQYMSQYY